MVNRLVQDWAYRYRDGGLAALEDQPRSGKRCKRDEPERERFRRRMLAGPLESDSVRALPGPEARKILQAEFGKKDSLPAVYALMHRLKLSPRRPVKQLKKNDPEAMKKWLADAPHLSRR